MLTNNYLAQLTRMFCEDVSSEKATKSITGNYTSTWNSIQNKRAKIGTGTTPPKVTDYKMESEIDASKYQASISNIKVTNFDNEGSTQCINVTVTNISREPLTVSEIGLENWGGTYEYNEDQHRLLIAREVFDTPITIPPGGGTGFQLKTLLTSLFQRGGAVYAY